MTPQETSIKHSALGWVKKSIDDNLSEIDTDLKLFVEEEDEALLERVQERLGVVQGVLLMIEQYGAAMLTEEMVALVDFIIENKQEQGEKALEVMLRAVLQLPDYLEHIQSGHRDIPIAILPLLNDIRAVRNQDLFSEKLLFLPDLTMHQEGAEIQAIDNDQNQASKLLTKKLRPVYQLALLNIIKDQSVDESLKRLQKVCETLEERSFSEQIARIWWIVGALIESVARQQLELGVSIKNLLGKVDALFRVILIIGERGLLQRQPIELIKNFLYYVAQPECDGPKAQAIKTAYRLEQFLPSESARSEVLNNIAGPNQALLKTVAEAMKADIEAVKSTLEVYVNGELSEVRALQDLPQEMHVISDTLAMIGLGPQRQLIEAQIEVVKGILEGNKPAEEEQLLLMAGELLQVEQSLDQMQKRQPLGATSPQTESDLSQDYELDSVLSAVVTAALDDIQKTKNAILEFIKDSSRTENIDLSINLMGESRGALELLGEQRGVAVVDGLLTYLKGHDIEAFLDTSKLDSLSRVVVSLEYYLEALGERRSDANGILDFADIQLEELLSSLPAKPAAKTAAQRPTPRAKSTPAAAPKAPDAKAPAEVTKPLPVADVVELGNEPDEIATTDPGLEEATAAQTAVSPDSADGRPAADPAKKKPSQNRLKVEPVDDNPEVLKSGSDPDILEIYLEEAAEESQNIARLQQDWLLHPEDENALKNIRRAFHTIKGSGRLVGAMKIGEFAWDYEQLLNRLIDKAIPPSKQIINAVGKAAQALPELVNELTTSTAPQADINYLRGLARALAEFKAEQLMTGNAQRQNAAESSDDRITNAEVTEREGPGASAPTEVITPTQVITPNPKDAALLEQIEPDTMQVAPAEFEAIKELAAEESEPADAGVASSFDDTVLAQPPQIPGASENQEASESEDIAVDDFEFDGLDTGYTQANDHAPATAEDDAIELEEIEAVDLESAAEEEIVVQTIGEDFLDDDASLQLEPAMPASAESEIEIMDLEVIEPEIEELVADTPVAPDELEAGATIAASEQAAAEAIDVEEIVVQAPAPEAAGMTLEISDLEADAGVASSQVDPASGGLQGAAAPAVGLNPARDKEEAPDPLAGTTGTRMPGEEAEADVSKGREPAAATGLSFDPELLTIYQQEVEQHLSIVSSALDQAEQAQELIPSEEVYRALHTISWRFAHRRYHNHRRTRRFDGEASEIRDLAKDGARSRNRCALSRRAARHP